MLLRKALPGKFGNCRLFDYVIVSSDYSFDSTSRECHHRGCRENCVSGGGVWKIDLLTT